MIKKGITLITAFFDIGRGDIENQSLRRSDEEYFTYFEHWARMQNMLIVYTEGRYVDSVIQIRKKFGLEDRTKVVAIDNIFEMEPDLFHKMCRIEQNSQFKKFRYFENAYSNTARYTYIMLMKYWCMKDSCEKDLVRTETVAWIDFGFDHGGNAYLKSNEFSFLWEYNFSEKINLFCLNNPDEMLGVDSLQLQCDCVMGALLCLPCSMTKTLWVLVRESMESLVSLDCIDDDQQLLLMSYKRQSELFEIHISNWFMPLKEYGGEHLTVKDKTNAKSGWKRKMKILLKSIKCLFVGDRKKSFARRCIERARKYYLA